jgi:hypothetical protein
MAAVRPRARYAEATAEEHADAEREKLIAEGGVGALHRVAARRVC